MDIADQAQQVEELHRKNALDALNRQSQKGTDYCIDCDEQIPLARKQAQPNANRCIDCQELAEKTK